MFNTMINSFNEMHTEKLMADAIDAMRSMYEQDLEKYYQLKSLAEMEPETRMLLSQLVMKFVDVLSQTTDQDVTMDFARATTASVIATYAEQAEDKNESYAEMLTSMLKLPARVLMEL